MNGIHAGGLTFERYWGAPKDGRKTRWARVHDGNRDACDINVHATPRNTFVLANGATAHGKNLREALSAAIARAQVTVDTLDALRCRTVTDPPPSPWALARQAKDLGLSRAEMAEILVGALDHAEAGQGWDVLGTWLEESVEEARADRRDMQREAADQARDIGAESRAWAAWGRR
jgi:hypothetical protein